jgi:hypothetical protein
MRSNGAVTTAAPGCRMGRGIRDHINSMSRLDALLRGEEPIVEITRRHATSVGDRFDEGVIFFVKSVEDKASELRVAKRLTDRQKCIGKGFDFIEVNGGGLVMLLHITELLMDGHRLSRRL